MNVIIVIAMLVITAGAALRFTNEAPVLDVFIIMIGSALFILGLFIVDTPSAMDVYRGKTTLEITYKDSIPVDSIVVFKDKEK